MSASETYKSNLAALNKKIAQRTPALGAPKAAPLDAGDLLRNYTYLPELTHRIEANLDALPEGEALDRSMLYEMVLWKLSRFVWLDDDVLSRLSATRAIAPGEHRKAEMLLRDLLRAKGVRLPMASTFLRFMNPDTFQIIDERAFRMVLPNEEIPAPTGETRTKGYLDRCCKLYFLYLDALHEISSEALPFSQADRVLYQLDKALGNGLGKRKPTNDQEDELVAAYANEN
ncbi:hypothetical protein LGN07_09910 [Burkholderia cepacia]|uniref:hypothetical protein n=1 Tax=Burkholderia cepacia TaxID=292 RepID=UPI00075BEE3A|nr:hypothetical protein [Burkholderia cepacia]KVS34324.1 hypothetical protein WK36_12905 [Burkholderia cepacia]MCA8119031.1 hypothetical protein [Burkholderia cepacia]